MPACEKLQKRRAFLGVRYSGDSMTKVDQDLLHYLLGRQTPVPRCAVTYFPDWMNAAWLLNILHTGTTVLSTYYKGIFGS